MEYQLFPEMRGKESILSNVTERWHQLFQMADECGISHVIGIIETHPADFHPSMADWYSFGALAENPHQSADEILQRWGRLNYPKETADALCRVLKKSYEAAGKVLYAGGVQCGIPKKPFGYLGNHDRIQNLYTEERKEELKNDPLNGLFAEMRPVDEGLKQFLLEEKEEGIRLYEEIREEWKKTGEVWKEKGEAYSFLLSMIEKNCGDARRFFKYMEFFLDWQMDCISTEQIREAEKEYVHTNACCSLHTCDQLFGQFLKNLYALASGNGEEEKSRTLPQYSEEEAKLL